MNNIIDKRTQLNNLQSVASQLRKPRGLPGKEIGFMMNKGNEQMNLTAIRQLSIEAHDSILEIGMGNGFFVKEILCNDKTIRYCGCDYSQTMVEEAMLLNEEYINNGQACFIKANADQMPFDNEIFDKVLTVNTIYFWKNVEIILSEIKRVLKPNGLFILSLRPKSVMDRLPIIQYGFQTFSKSSCIQILRRNGFEIISSAEKEDNDIELSGTKYRNAFMTIKAIKN